MEKVSTNQHFRMKHLTIVILAVLLLSACQESLEERCEREAREYTEKKCPALIVKNVTIDSMAFDKSTHTMTYYYTLDGVLDDAKALKEHNLRGMLHKELKNSTQTQLYKEAGYNFHYVYFSTKNNGTKLFEATFHKKDYQ